MIKKRGNLSFFVILHVNWVGMRTLNLNGRLVGLSSPMLMPIVNLSPESFYTHFGGGADALVCWMGDMMSAARQAGVELLFDFGGCSTRPGGEVVSVETEWCRLEPVLKAVSRSVPDAFVSVDTFRPEIALRCADYGVSVVNDVLGGRAGGNMFRTIGKTQQAYVLTYSLGGVEDMHKRVVEDDVVSAAVSYFRTNIESLRAEGVRDIILDVGFGFGKTDEQNWLLLDRLSVFREFGMPLLAGISRKSMLSRAVGRGADGVLAATVAAEAVALSRGADILRVHDVREALDTIKIISKL